MKRRGLGDVRITNQIKLPCFLDRYSCLQVVCNNLRVFKNCEHTFLQWWIPTYEWWKVLCSLFSHLITSCFVCAIHLTFFKCLVFIIVTSSIAFLFLKCLLHFAIHHYCKLRCYSFEEKVVLNTCNHVKIYVITLPWNMDICEVIEHVQGWAFSYVGLLLMCFNCFWKGVVLFNYDVLE